MTTQDKIDNAMLAAVVARRLNGESPELGDSVYNLEVPAERDSWIRYDQIAVTQLHLDAAAALLQRFRGGYRDPAMTESAARTWCKTWAGLAAAKIPE